MEKIIERVELAILSLIILVFPLTVTTLFPNTFDTSKLALLFGGFLLLGVIAIIKSFVIKELKFKMSRKDLLVLFFMAVFIASSIFRTGNLYDALLLPGTAGFVLLGGIYYFIANQFKKDQKKMLVYSIVLSAVILSLIQTAVFLGYYKSAGYTPIGNLSSLIALLLPSLALAIFGIVTSKNMTEKALNGVAGFIIFVGTFSAIYLLLPGKPTSLALPSFITSWAVTTDTIKDSPFLGVGPGRYSAAFNRNKPLVFNQESFWNVRFATASNQFFTLITETGILGLLAFILIALSFVKKSNFKSPRPIHVALLLFMSLFFVFPFTNSLYLVLFVLLALTNDASNSRTVNVTPPVLLGVPMIIIVAVSSYFGIRALIGEYYFGKSVKAVSTTDSVSAKPILDNMQKALNMSSKVDRYHFFLSNLDLNLAQSLGSKGDQLTDEEKTTITQLISQSIDQAKAAASLNPTKVGNWENLASIYAGVIAYAKGADDYAIAAYSQAIALEPINPNLRIALGGIYFGRGDYDTAIEVFKLAVLAKPDLANSHYNLGAAYRENGQNQKALEQMKATLSLLDEGSKDYQAVKNEIDSLESQQPSTPPEGEQPQPEQLTTPVPQPEPAIEPQIEIPQESPSPTPEAQ